MTPLQAAVAAVTEAAGQQPQIVDGRYCWSDQPEDGWIWVSTRSSVDTLPTIGIRYVSPARIRATFTVSEPDEYPAAAAAAWAALEAIGENA